MAVVGPPLRFLEALFVSLWGSFKQVLHFLEFLTKFWLNLFLEVIFYRQSLRPFLNWDLFADCKDSSRPCIVLLHLLKNWIVLVFKKQTNIFLFCDTSYISKRSQLRLQTFVLKISLARSISLLRTFSVFYCAQVQMLPNTFHYITPLSQPLIAVSSLLS